MINAYEWRLEVLLLIDVAFIVVETDVKFLHCNYRHGLAKTTDTAINWSEANFNTPLVR